MTRYGDLFDATAPDESVFADKGALDPLTSDVEIVGREEQERQLATLLNGVHEGYLPPTISVYGPPGTGKTVTTRRLCTAFADRTECVGAEYVNLKECRTLFSAANELLAALTGERKQAYEGLDGVFTGIWEAIAEYPEYTVVILDEIDHIKHDSNYDTSDFFYRLLRGEGKLARNLCLSLVLISNELIADELVLDSRVQSAMSGEEVYFPPYDFETLSAVVSPRLDRAFRSDTIPDEVRTYGVIQATKRWGDARKALTLFRRAGEMANEREDPRLTRDDIDRSIEAVDDEAITEKLLTIPYHHFLVISAMMLAASRAGDLSASVTTDQIQQTYAERATEADQLSTRAVRDIITDLETMGLLETWVESRGRNGRVKQVRSTFDLQLLAEVQEEYRHRSAFFAPDAEATPSE